MSRTTRGTVVYSQGGHGGAPVSGLNWGGAWSLTATYRAGTFVYVDETPVAGDGNNYTGIWLCLVACSGQQPVYPHPTPQYWQLIAMWPRVVNVADTLSDQSKKMLVAASDPYDPGY